MIVTVIHNRSAGEGESERALEKALRAEHHLVTVFGSDMDEISDALEVAADVVVIAGGDGTVRHVATKLIDRPLPFAILLAGTANNFGRTVGGFDSPQMLAAALATTTPRAIDTALATIGARRVSIFESAGCGLFTSLMKALKNRSRRERIHDREQGFRGEVEAMRTLLRDAPPVEITIDGETNAFALVELMNTRSIGPNLPLALQALPDDGLLDVVCVADGDRHALDEFLRLRIEGGMPSLGLPLRRAKHVELRAPADAFHIDDQMDFGEDVISVAIHVLPGSLRVIAPS